MLLVEATAGGTGRYVRELTAGLLEVGVAVHLVCSLERPSKFGAYLPELERAGAQIDVVPMVREIRPGADLRSVRRLLRLLKEKPPDILHLHSSKAGFIGRIAARLAAFEPVIYSPHAYAFLDESRRIPSRLAFLAEKILRPWVNHVLAVSHSERRTAIERGLISAARVSAIATGPRDLPADDTVAAARRRREACPVRRIGFLGRLVPQKQPLLLPRLALALHSVPAVKMYIAGDGPLKARCEAEIRSLGLCRKVVLRPAPADAAAFLRSLDLFVMTSAFEGMPYAALDAMAWEIPIVALRCDGISDAVVNNVTGLLESHGDLGALAERTASLLRSAERRRTLGRAARRRLLTHFRWTDQVRAIVALYGRLLGWADVAGR